MADLHKHEFREAWLKWAIEFMRRGLWADEYIEVHGPHGPEADYMWGDAEAWEDGGNQGGEVIFQTARGIRGIHAVRGVRMEYKDAVGGERLRLPLVPMSGLSRKARHWLRVAKVVHDRLRQKEMAEKRESKFRRSQLA